MQGILWHEAELCVADFECQVEVLGLTDQRGGETAPAEAAGSKQL